MPGQYFPVTSFTTQLFGDAISTLTDDQPPDSSDVVSAVNWVIEFESAWRDELPPAPPPVDRVSLEWAIRQFYAAAQFIVFRQLAAEDIPRRIATTPRTDLDESAEITPSEVYSVDLVFRFLPDLWRIARAANPQDPILDPIRTWGSNWPLSSVGIPVLEIKNLEPILAHPSLGRMYADRIIAAGAKERLNDPDVRHMVSSLLGAHPKLAGPLAASLVPLSHREQPIQTE